MFKQYLTGLVDCNGEYPFGYLFHTRRGNIIFKNHKPKDLNCTVIGNKRIPNKHLIIETNSQEKAKEILDLILDCNTVIDSFIRFDWDDNFHLTELNKSIKAFPRYFITDSIYLAGVMASRASFKENYIYAIHQLALSLHIVSAAPVDLDPTSGKLETSSIAKPFPTKIRVAIAAAIVEAYSAIQELNLEILPKDKDPKIDKWFSKDGEGKLLPETQKDMIGRLKKAKININETFDWSKIGGKKIIEKKNPFKQKFNKSPWSYGIDRRDDEIDLITAIDRASFLRSKVAAHKLSSAEGGKKKMIKVLSIYDVSNIQLLTRRLILESLELWGSL